MKTKPGLKYRTFCRSLLSSIILRFVHYVSYLQITCILYKYARGCIQTIQQMVNHKLTITKEYFLSYSTTLT